MSNQIAALPKPERMRFYSRMAFETSRLAEAATVPEARDTFLKLARCWNALAEELAEEEEPAEAAMLIAAA